MFRQEYLRTGTRLALSKEAAKLMSLVKYASKTFRYLVVAISIAAWFSISNHCVIAGAVAAKTHAQSATSHCHGNLPAPSKKHDDVMPCCKGLNALEAKVVTVNANTIDFVAKDYLSALVLPIISEPHKLLIACDSGPPEGVFSFSESVLQRSILAHAPPSFS